MKIILFTMKTEDVFPIETKKKMRYLFLLFAFILFKISMLKIFNQFTTFFIGIFFKSEEQSTQPLNSQNYRGGPNEPHCQDSAVPEDWSSWKSIGWSGGRCFAHGKLKRAVMWEDDRCGSLPEIGPHSAPQLLWAPSCKGRELFPFQFFW